MHKENKSVNIVLTVALSIALILMVYMLMVQVSGFRNDGNDAPKRLVEDNVTPRQTDGASQTRQADAISKDPQADGAASGNKVSTEKDAVSTDSGKNTELAGSGRYEGQADSNFIEITIADGQGNAAFRAFQLNDALKERFDDLGLEIGDIIIFTYEEREGQNPLLTSLEKE